MDCPETAELRKLGPGVFYLTPATSPPLLHLLLNSQTSVAMSVDALQWCSEGVLIGSNRSFFDTVFGGSSNLVTVTNLAANMGYVGIRKPSPGRAASS